MENVITYTCQITLHRYSNHRTVRFSSIKISLKKKPDSACCNKTTGRSLELSPGCSLDKPGRKLRQWKKELLDLQQQGYTRLIQVQTWITYSPRQTVRNTMVAIQNCGFTYDAFRLPSACLSYIIRPNGGNK